MSRRRLAVPARVCACVAVLAAGCGEPTQEDQVRGTLATFVTAAEEKDYKTLCEDVLAQSLLAKLAEVNVPCEIAMRQGFGAVDEPKLKVGRVRVSDDKRTANAEVETSAKGQKPSQDIVELVREEDDWRIASLAGAAPPAPTPSTFVP